MVDEFERYVALNDTDAAGVIYAASPSSWFQEGVENLYRAAGHPLEQVLQSAVDYPVVNLTINHRNVLRLGDRVRVVTRATRVGGRSVTFACTVFREDGVVAVAMEQTQVAVSNVDRTQKAELEPWIRELAESEV